MTSQWNKVFACVIFLSLLNRLLAVHNLDDYGGQATTTEPDVRVAKANSDALIKMLNASNSDANDRIAFVPNKVYYFSAIQVDDLHDIVFQVDGILRAHSNIREWPKDQGGTGLDEMIFKNANNFTLRGSGVIDGQGYGWWWNSISEALPFVNHNDLRGKMISIKESTNILVEGLTFMNSPTWHLNIEDCDNVVIRDFVIWVNVTSQKEMLQSAGLWTAIDPTGPLGYGIPTFPLNTDGIDPSASNVHIYNGVIDNYDDAIVFKPCRSDYKYCKCSGGYVHDIKTLFSVGMSIGSVPPRDPQNCVKDVVFKDIKMEYPIKAIYIKSNPGNSGTGLVQNITYENIFIYRALWWAIWIGPQQQHQPGGSSTGCEFYFPRKGSSCPSNPLVTFRDITLRNVTAVDGLNQIAGMIIADPSNPGRNFVFDRVLVQQGKDQDYTQPFYTHDVYGTTRFCLPDFQFLSE